jgi:AcrR family transcriptional regulator
VVVDGRQLRRESNRQAVVEALVALYREGRFEPSAAEIADRAGLSPRSLFRYFDDTDDLVRAAIDHHHRLARPLVAIDAAPDDPLPVRVERLVANRIRLWTTVEPSARIARMKAPVSDLLGPELRRNRAMFRQQISTLFAAEVTGRPEVLAVLDVLCSFESVDLLLHDQGLSSADAAAALVSSLTALLEGPRR